jgi:long-chain acyl-CoA synthetase
MTTTLEHTNAPDLSRAFPTVAWRIREWARTTPDRVAMRDKDFGIWQERTSAQIWDEVLTAAHALLALGVRPGDVTSIHSEDRPEWLIFDFATVAIRGICTGMYPTNPTAEVQYLLNDAGATVHVAEDQEQVDKVLEPGRDAFPTISTIVYLEPRGVHTMDDDRLTSWDEFMAIGRDHREANPGAVERLMADAEPDEVMTLIYTSGTTGPPKGAMLTHRNIEFAVENVLNDPSRFAAAKGENTTDEKLTYLPLCHVAERLFSSWSMAYNGPILNFAESIDTVQMNLREVQPTIFFAVPRIWERIHAGVLIRLQDATRLKRLTSAFGLKLAAYIGAKRVENNGDFTLGAKLAYWVGNPIFFRSLRTRIGFAIAGTHRRAPRRSHPRSSSSSWGSESRCTSCMA